jgi:uncharacterized damage-inducible protein DinB
MDAPLPYLYPGSQTRLFAEYNRWMNQKLYAAAATLPDEARKRDLRAFFGSLHGTLAHILWADTSWLARFQGTPVSLPKVGTWLHESFDDLRRAREAKDQEILAWAAQVTDEWLAAPRTWKSAVYETTFRHPTWALVAQMFNHQTHHRGQATTLLFQLGVDPGVTDLPLLPALNEPPAT